ncbi:MAG: hypothetical protein Q9192_006621, partial [Flavoplaca navasiana]
KREIREAAIAAPRIAHVRPEEQDQNISCTVHKRATNTSESLGIKPEDPDHACHDTKSSKNATAAPERELATQSSNNSHYIEIDETIESDTDLSRLCADTIKLSIREEREISQHKRREKDIRRRPRRVPPSLQQKQSKSGAIIDKENCHGFQISVPPLAMTEGRNNRYPLTSPRRSFSKSRVVDQEARQSPYYTEITSMAIKLWSALRKDSCRVDFNYDPS